MLTTTTTLREQALAAAQERLAEQERVRHTNQAAEARQLERLLRDTFGLSATVPPGQADITIDGLSFVVSHEYHHQTLGLKRPCTTCGKLAAVSPIQDLATLGAYIDEPITRRTCSTCANLTRSTVNAPTLAEQLEDLIRQIARSEIDSDS